MKGVHVASKKHDNFHSNEQFIMTIIQLLDQAFQNYERTEHL
jgi:hypothetical protein